MQTSMSLSPEGLTEWPPSQHERHRPEAALLYQIVEEYWPSFQAELDSQGKSLPHFVAKELHLVPRREPMRRQPTPNNFLFTNKRCFQILSWIALFDSLE